ncbi:MAG: hypothetical protein HYS06_11635 [Methylocystis sp.]|nr:hypothetical protein [Methylocystis sp.]
MTDEPPTDEPPKEAQPQFRVNPGLYVFAAIVLIVWVFVTFFFRNPYLNAVSFDYYDRHPYDETTVWIYVLVIVPLIGLGAFLLWIMRARRK